MGSAKAALAGRQFEVSGPEREHWSNVAPWLVSRSVSQLALVYT